MSVPRPAILVATVTAPFSPALAIISASLALFLAFKTSWSIFLAVNIWLINSLVSTAIVPISIGCPNLCLLSTSSINEINLPFCVGYSKSGASILSIFLLVGIQITLILYISLNSSSSVLAVPVIPDNLLYILNKFWNVIVAKVLVSWLILTFSLASIAWWRPSLYALPFIKRPVNWSTITISPLLTT